MPVMPLFCVAPNRGRHSRGTPPMQVSKTLGALTTALLLSTTGAYAAENFNRIASFPVALNAPDAEATSSEIITATDDGLTLIYSDSPNGGIGFIDITDAASPKEGGYHIGRAS